MSSNAAVQLQVAVNETISQIKRQMEYRAYEGANELKKASVLVLRGQRGGRRYKVPGTYRLQTDKATGKKRHGRYYTASAPGEPPAVRTGAFRQSWQPTSRALYGSYISRIESDARTDNGKYVLGELLEEGTSKMAPRPHHKRIQEKALPNIKKIYNRSYF